MVYIRYRCHVVDKETGNEISEPVSSVTIAINSNYALTSLPINGATYSTSNVTPNYIWCRCKAVLSSDSEYTIDTSEGSESFKLEVRFPQNSQTVDATYSANGEVVDDLTYITYPDGIDGSRNGWNIYKSEYDSANNNGSSSTNRVTLDFYIYLTRIPEPQPITLSYNANGGDGAPASEQSETGVFTISDTIPTFDGKVFLGWSTDWQATSAEYVAGDEITITEDTVLYAVWENYIPPEPPPEPEPTVKSGYLLRGASSPYLLYEAASGHLAYHP